MRGKVLFSAGSERFTIGVNLGGMGRKFHVGILYFEDGKTCRIWRIFLRRVIYRDYRDLGSGSYIGIVESLEEGYLSGLEGFLR